MVSKTNISVLLLLLISSCKERVIKEMYCYNIPKLYKLAHPAIAIYHIKDSSKVINWYDMVEEGLEPFAKDGLGSFINVPIGAKVKVLRYYHSDSSLVKIKAELNRPARMDPTFVGYTARVNLHENPPPDSLMIKKGDISP